MHSGSVTYIAFLMTNKAKRSGVLLRLTAVVSQHYGEKKKMTMLEHSGVSGLSTDAAVHTGAFSLVMVYDVSPHIN